MKTMLDDEPYEQWGYLAPHLDERNASAWIIGPSKQRVRNLQKLHRGGRIARRIVGPWEIVDE